MPQKRDITSTFILIAILLIISGLVFYLFFYQGDQTPPTSQFQDKDQNALTLVQDQAKDQNTPISWLSKIETKYKGQNVYVLDPRVKIRSEPHSDATVLAEKKRCDRLFVTGAQGDWFEVDYDAEQRGWILRDQVSDRNPCQKRIEPSEPVQENVEHIQALDQIRTELDNLTAMINQRALQQFGQEMINGFEILNEGKKLTIYVTKAWYILPPLQKQVMFNLLAMNYGRQTCMYRVRSECSQNDFPTINFLNHENREVARMAANQPLQIFE